MLAAPCDSVSAAQSGTAEKNNAAKYESMGIIPEGFSFSEGECFKNRYGVSCFKGVWKNKNGICLYIDSADGFIIDCFIGSYEKNKYCENGISYEPDSSFPTADDIISPDEAGMAYVYKVQGMPVILGYRYDGNSKTVAPFYYSEVYQETAVDAKTGTERFPYFRGFYYQTAQTILWEQGKGLPSDIKQEWRSGICPLYQRHSFL